MAVFLSIGLASAAATAILILSYQPARLGPDGSFTSNDRNVLLEPSAWHDSPLPLLPYVDIGDRIGTGDWTVMLYRPKCRACRKAIEMLSEQARRRPVSGPVRFALVELPPYAPPGKSPVPAGSPFTLGRLTDQRRWFVHTPTIVRLHDGRVTEVRQTDR